MIASLITPVTELISKFIPDKDQAAKLAFEVATMADKQAHDQMLAQLAVNAAEAAHPSVWKGGWRPAVGWACALALFSNYILTPYMAPLFLLQWGYVMPVLDMAVMMPLLLGMLGLASARTFEKTKGVASP